MYGWPLLLSGILLFATSQADRFVVGSFLGMPALGIYAAAALIPVAVNQLILGTSANLLMPVLSGVSGDRRLFEARYDLVFASTAALAIVAFVPLIGLGHLIIPAVFGARYQAPALLVAWLAIGAAAGVLRGAPAIAALALGDTKNLLYANVVRPLGLAAALVAVHLGHGIVAVATAIALGELLATVYAVVRLSRAFDVPLLRGLLYVGGAIACCLGALAYLMFDVSSHTPAGAMLGILTIDNLRYRRRSDPLTRGARTCDNIGANRLEAGLEAEPALS